MGTLWEYIYTLQVVSFLVFWHFFSQKTIQNAPLELWGHFQCTHVHPMMSLAQKWCDLVTYTVSKFGVIQTDSSQDTADFVSLPPVAVHTHNNDNLFHSAYFTWYATHGLPSASSCTTPYNKLGCWQPDVRVLPIQVPAWDLDLNLQDQGWGKTWLPTLHPGQRGLCCHGQMGTSRWSTQEWPCEVLRLQREHVKWDLPKSSCLQVGRHHKEVWWIHQWASRLDMPTHPQGTNWQWQWCCNRVRSSMQADLHDPRCQHQAAQTTSEGQLWQEGITSTRDLQNILYCGIRSSCHVCRSWGTCCTPHPPGTQFQATDIICTMPQLHPSTPSQ